MYKYPPGETITLAALAKKGFVMGNDLRSPRWMMALNRIKRILSQNNIEFQVSGEWTLDELIKLCEQVDDLELMRYLAILQVESGRIDARVTGHAA